MKTANYFLHLKVSDEIKVFEVVMQSDEEAEMDTLSMIIDEEKIELAGNAESILWSLLKF